MKASASDVPVATPSPSRRSSVFTKTAIVVAADMMPGVAHLDIGGVSPEMRPLSLEGPAEERVRRRVEVLDQAADLAFNRLLKSVAARWFVVIP